jgi:hypothetical protein
VVRDLCSVSVRSGLTAFVVPTVGYSGTSPPEIAERLVVGQRQMGVHVARLLGVASVALTVVTVSGSGRTSSLGSGGAWAGCTNVAPSEVQVRRTVAFSRPGLLPLSVIQPDPEVVPSWFRDACAIMAHPYSPPGGSTWECPASFGLSYDGVFYMGHTKVAVLTYRASGCEGFTLSVGADQISTNFMGAGAAVSSRFDDDLAAVFGIRPDAIHSPPPTSRP